MPKISGKIPKRAFELVREKIGAILADEFAGQYEAGDVRPSVYVSRQRPYSKEEGTVVIIRTVTGSYDNEDVRSSDGTYTYYVDVYITAQSTRDEGTMKRGDEMSRTDVEQLTGLIWAILKNPIYRTLDFKPPFISNVTIGNFAISEYTIEDSESITFARLELSVRVPEFHNLIEPAMIGAHSTTVKLSTSNNGYYYEYIQNKALYKSNKGKYYISQSNKNFIKNA